MDLIHLHPDAPAERDVAADPAAMVQIRPAPGSRPRPIRVDARPVEPSPSQPSPGAPPLDPDAPVPDDPGPLEEPDLLPPPPLEPSPDVVPAAEPV